MNKEIIPAAGPLIAPNMARRAVHACKGKGSVFYVVGMEKEDVRNRPVAVGSERNRCKDREESSLPKR